MFKTVSKHEDPYRPVGANMNGRLGDSLSPVLDVQDFSHRNGNDFDGFHKDFPKIPTIGSECCSCITNRGEDTSNSSRPSVGNVNGNCNSGQNGVELKREFVAGHSCGLCLITMENRAATGGPWCLRHSHLLIWLDFPRHQHFGTKRGSF